MESQIVPGICSLLCGRWQWYIHPLLFGLESLFILHRFSRNVQKVSLRAAGRPPVRPSIASTNHFSAPERKNLFFLFRTLRAFFLNFCWRSIFWDSIFLISSIIFSLLSFASLNMTLKTSGGWIFFFFACFFNLLKFPMLKCVLSRSLYFFNKKKT